MFKNTFLSSKKCLKIHFLELIIGKFIEKMYNLIKVIILKRKIYDELIHWKN